MMTNPDIRLILSRLGINVKDCSYGCVEQKTVGHVVVRWRKSWWRLQVETFSALLALCAGNSPVNGAFPAQTPVTRSFDVSFDMRPNKRLRKQSWVWWFETPSCPLWRHCHVQGSQCWVLLLYAIPPIHVAQRTLHIEIYFWSRVSNLCCKCLL